MKTINTIEGLLSLNLQYFADGEEADTSSDATENTEISAEKQPEHMIPKTRFDEVNARYKKVQAQLDEIMSAQKATETKAQEEAGEFKQLYESIKSTHDTLEARNKELEGVVGELLKSKLEGIAEEFHDLIPDNLTPEAKLSWINKAEAKGLFGKKEQKPVGTQTNGETTKTTMTKEQFQKLGYQERTAIFESNPELYNKLNK
ncbi:hypothetical protein [Bacillus sp. JJ722]|uniref:hypothetical protein n=1 Tax=Bacillus sp. JJ722 TaxID=3122973 RepID=UPI002FFF261E